MLSRNIELKRKSQLFLKKFFRSKRKLRKNRKKKLRRLNHMRVKMGKRRRIKRLLKQMLRNLHLHSQSQ